MFSQELAALLKAGLPLFQSLDVMLERQRDPLFRQSLAAVREKVKSGVALSDAFRQEGGLYPPIFAASLVAGERSGNLDAVLRRFAAHLRLNQSCSKKAVSASVYPIVLLCMMAALVAVLLVFVIPQFQSFYQGLNVELPLPTRVLLASAGRAAGQRAAGSCSALAAGRRRARVVAAARGLGGRDRRRAAARALLRPR